MCVNGQPTQGKPQMMSTYASTMDKKNCIQTNAEKDLYETPCQANLFVVCATVTPPPPSTNRTRTPAQGWVSSWYTTTGAIAIVIRTHGAPKSPYISPCLNTTLIFAHVYTQYLVLIIATVCSPVIVTSREVHTAHNRKTW